MSALANLSPRYWDAFKSSLFQQSWLFIAATLLLESLKADLFVLVAVAGHWLIMLLIAMRRPETPTRADLLFCEFGFVPVAIVTIALAPIVWFAVGDTTLYERWFGRSMIADPGALLPVQVVAGAWIVVYFVLEIFWRKPKSKSATAASDLAAAGDETVAKVDSVPDSAETPRIPQPSKVKRTKGEKGTERKIK